MSDFTGPDIISSVIATLALLVTGAQFYFTRIDHKPNLTVCVDQVIFTNSDPMKAELHLRFDVTNRGRVPVGVRRIELRLKGGTAEDGIGLPVSFGIEIGLKTGEPLMTLKHNEVVAYVMDMAPQYRNPVLSGVVTDTASNEWAISENDVRKINRALDQFTENRNSASKPDI